jgi:hypothetical protein
MPTPEQFQALQDLGTAGFLAFALIGGFRGWYVWHREFLAVKADRDYWRGVALESMGHTEKALDIAKRPHDA